MRCQNARQSVAEIMKNMPAVGRPRAWGTALFAASAYQPARTRLTISMPECARSQPRRPKSYSWLGIPLRNDQSIVGLWYTICTTASGADSSTFNNTFDLNADALLHRERILPRGRDPVRPDRHSKPSSTSTVVMLPTRMDRRGIFRAGAMLRSKDSNFRSRCRPLRFAVDGRSIPLEASHSHRKFPEHLTPTRPATEIKTPLMDCWEPLLSHPDAVLISAGRTRVVEDELPEPANATIEQHILRPEARVSFSAVEAISQVVGFLQTYHKQFRIHEADSNNLGDLHRRPVVLVSGYNNTWTLRLLRPLRFHFEQIGSLHYIVDAQHPDRSEWSVDFNTPYRQETEDYAIIGRFNDPTTGGPVVVVAGIGSNGSEAAGEFIVSPDDLELLARLAPGGKLDKNFEAVLKVQVIAGDTGAATLVATQFW
jgi:hypothetical protein